jgi:hypothetical protein
VEILDDQDDRGLRALAGHQLGPALADPVVHQARALAGGAQRRDRVVGERRADELAEEGGAEVDAIARHRTSDPGAQRRAPLLGRIAVADAALPAQRLRHHAER